jgi:hypothetical protein
MAILAMLPGGGGGDIGADFDADAASVGFSNPPSTCKQKSWSVPSGATSFIARRSVAEIVSCLRLTLHRARKLDFLVWCARRC